MPIRLPVLDDRTYADLSLELRALIPSYAPDWTDHNPSDPGITLLELFAWLAEGLLYRVDRVPEASTVRMLELLGAVFRPAQPATVVLRARLAGTGMPAAGLTLPAGARLTARPAGQDTLLPFETVDDVRLTPEWLEALVTARQVARTASEFLGRSNGQPHQRFSLLAAGAGAVFIEPTGSSGVRSCAPAVSVNGQAWEYRADLVHSGPEDRHFTVDTRRSLIRFGPGREDETRRAGPASDVQREGGAVPPAAAVIQADYCYTLGAGGNMPAGGMYALTDAQGAGGNLPTAIAWEAIGPATGGQGPTSLEDARAEVYRIINNAWRAITNEDFEQLVLGQASLHVARAKSLPEVEVAGSRRKGGARGLDQASSVGAGATRAGAAGTAEGEPELRPEAGHVSLMVFPQPTREPVAAITELDEEALSVREVEFSQDGQVLAVWLAPAEANRSVVGADRVWIWQAARAGAGQGSSPEPLPLPDEASVTSLALSSDGRWLALAVLRGGGRDVILWDVQRLAWVEVPHPPTPSPAPAGEGETAPAPAGEPVTGIVFRPDGRQVLIVIGNTVERRSVPSWALEGSALHPAPVLSAMFAPSCGGRSDGVAVRGVTIATLAEDNSVRLWGRLRGEAPLELLAVLRHEERVGRLLFSPDGRWVVTLSGAKTVLAWPLDQAGAGPGLLIEPVRMGDAAPGGLGGIERVTGIAFRQRGRRLAVVGSVRADDDGTTLQGGAGRSLAFADVETGAVESTRQLPVGNLVNEFSPDLRRLLLADAPSVDVGAVDGRDALHPQLWDVDMNRRVGVLHHDDPVFAALFSPEGDHVVTLAGRIAGLRVARAWNTEGAALETMISLEEPLGAAGRVPEPPALAARRAAKRELALQRTLSRQAPRPRGLELAPGRANPAVAGSPLITGVLGPEGKFLLTWQTVADGEGPAQVRPDSLRVWEAEHLARAWEFLDERRLVTTQHHVVGTRFVDVQVRAAVVPAPRADAGALVAAIRDSLADFFAPLAAGPLRDGGGWPFGRHVHLSEVYQVIEGVAGVDHVEALNLYTREEDGTPSAGGQPAQTSAPGAATLAPWYDSGPEVFVPPNQLVHYVRLPMARQELAVETAEEPDGVRDIIVRRTG